MSFLAKWADGCGGAGRGPEESESESADLIVSSNGMCFRDVDGCLSYFRLSFHFWPS